MATKKKSILEKRLSESEERLKSALDRLNKASKSFASKNNRQADLEKGMESLAMKLEVTEAEQEKSLTTVAGLQEKIAELETAASAAAAAAAETPAPESSQGGEAETMKAAIRDALDATVVRLEALVAGRLTEAG